MAQKLVVEVIADLRQYTRGLNTASKQANGFTREVERAGRGAVAGSGVFRGLGRSLAFASGGFIAFSSGTAFLRQSIDAAREAAVAQRQLAAQMRASGESFVANRKRIDQVATSYEKFGFNADQVIQSLTVLERGTHHINTAIRLQGLTANIARAKNIDLAAAANIVAKVFGGQETALRRAVPGLSKAAHGWDLIRLAQERMAGQAAASTTTAERFSAALHDTEVQIGQALLPTLNKALDGLSKWLQGLNKNHALSKQFGSDVQAMTDVLGPLASGFANATKKAYDFRGFLQKHIPGGSYLFAGPLQGLKRFEQSGHDAITKLNALLGLQHDVVVRAPKGPRGMTPGDIVKQAKEYADAQAKAARTVAAATPRFGPGGPQPSFQDQISRALSRLQMQPLQQQLVRLRQLASIIRDRITHARTIQGRLKLEDTLWQLIGSEKQVREQLVQNALAALQLGVDRAGLTKGLGDDLNALRRLEAYLRARIKVTKDNLALQQQLVGVQQQILSVQQQQAQQEKQAAQLEKQRQQQAAARRAAATQARQFGLLGLDPSGSPLVPGVKALQKELDNLEKKLAGTALGRQQAGVFARIEKLLTGRFGKLGKNVRQAIKQMLDNILGQIQTSTQTATAAAAATAPPGTAVPINYPRSFGLAGAGYGYGYQPARPTTGMVINGGLNLYGVQDVHQLEEQLVKRAGQRPQTRRGPV